MYVPTPFRMDDRADIHDAIRATRLASLVTATADGLLATPLPLLLEADEGPWGTLYGHVARANPQWQAPQSGEAMAIFMGPDAYVTPAWYATKGETGRVVPTWNYVAVHVYGPLETFEDPARLLDVVSRLTAHHERARPEPWAVADAPAAFTAAQLRGIVGVRLPIARLEGKRKMSQNRTAADRDGVARGLGASDDAMDRQVASLIPVDRDRSP